MQRQPQRALEKIMRGTRPCSALGSSLLLLVAGVLCSFAAPSAAYAPETWGAPQRVDFANFSAGADVSHAANAAGTAVIVWRQQVNSTGEVYASFLGAGGNWSGPQLVSAPGARTFGGTGTRSTAVAVDGYGRAMAFWYQQFNGTYHLAAASYLPGTGWGATIQVENGEDGPENIHVASDAAGNVTLAWGQPLNGTDAVMVATCFIGGPCGRATAINTGPVYYPDVAVDYGGDGWPMVAWVEGDVRNRTVWSSWYESPGVWRAPVRVDLSASLQGGLSLNVNGAGQAQLAWSAPNQSQYDNDPLAARFEPVDGWGAPFQLDSGLSGDGGGARSAINERGDGLVVWRQQDAAQNERTYANAFVAGTGWTGPQAVGRLSGNGTNIPDTVAIDDGSFVVAWAQGGHMWAALYQPGAGFYDEVNTSGGTPAYYFPSIGQASSREVTIVFRAASLGSGGIWANVMQLPSDSQAPTVDVGPGATIKAGQPFSRTAAVTDDDPHGPDGFWAEWVFDHNGSTVRLAGAAMTYTFWTPGNYLLSFTVRDFAGNPTTATTWLDVLPPDLQAPVVQLGRDFTAASGSPITLTMNVTDNDAAFPVGAAFEWSFRYNGSDQVLAGRALNFTFWTPGTYNISASARDAAGNWGADNITITIPAPDVAWPLVQALQNIEARQGREVAFQANATDDDPDFAATGVYNWSFTYGGSTIQLRGRLVNFTFDEPGNYTVTLVVTDGAGNAAPPVAFVVHVTPPPKDDGPPSNFIPDVPAMAVLVALVAVAAGHRLRRRAQ